MRTDLTIELRIACRQLLKNPAFSLVAIITLALGIGATTALFSVVYGVLISPYPYARPHEIWAPGVRSAAGEQRMRPYRMREFEAMAQLPAFSATMATSPGNALLTGEFGAETITAIRVSGNAFEFLGVQPIVGRAIGAFDVSPSGGAQHVAVLSFAAWQRLFGGGEVLNRTLVLDGKPHTIVGVMPSRFGWWTSDGLWLPLGRESGNTIVFPIARLNPGTLPAAAEQQLHGLQRELAVANPSGFPKDAFATTLTNYLDITVASGQMRRSLRLLFWAVAFLLLIACANVANLQLARGASRAREIAVRISLGARRVRIIRQLLFESVVLSLLGGVAGLACAFALTRLIVNLMPVFFVPNESRIELHGFALGFCAAVSVCTGIASGLVPALHASRADPGHALKEESRGTSGSSGRRMRNGLVIAEVAISVILLGSAAVTVRSFVALQQLDLGFRPDRVLTFQLPPPSRSYVTAEARNQFAQALVERVKGLPGVEAVAVGNGGMPFGGPSSPFAIDGQRSSDERRIRVHLVSDQYLRVLGIPLLRGRMLTEREVNGAQHVAVINETAAALWRPGEDPIGRHIGLDALEPPVTSPVLVPGAPVRDVTVVGIVGDARNDGVMAKPQPAVLVPYTLLAPPQRVLAVRATGATAPLVSGVRAVVREMDPLQPVSAPRSLEEIVGSQFAQPRFIMALFSVFAALGLALAMAGLYSVLSYVVSTRVHEIGIRMALGARQIDILRLICWGGGKLVAWGSAVGLLGVVASSGLLGSQLQLTSGSADDPRAYFAVGLVVAAVACVACLVPARRAAKVAPADAMR